MAYVFDPRLSEEENLRKASEGEANRPATGEITGGGQPAGGAPVTGAPTASGSFTNLQRYLTENQSQAKGLAERVAGQIGAAGQDAKGAAEGFVNEAGQKIDAGRVAPQTDLLDEAAKDPTSVSLDPTKREAFLKQRDATYGGPRGLEDVPGFETAQEKVRKAQETIGLAGSEAGRTQLLTNLSPAGSGKGKLALNNLLISGSPEAGDILAGAGEPYKNLSDYLAAQSADARARAVQATQEAQGTRQTVHDRFLGDNGVASTMSADLLARLGGAREAAGARTGAITGDLGSYNLSDQDLADLGLSRQDFDLLKGYKDFTGGAANTDLSKYLTSLNPEAEITAANFASQDDYAREAALEDLMGINLPGLSPADLAKAGTAPKELVNYDVTGAKTGAKNKFNSYMGRAIPQMDAHGSTGPGPGLGDIAGMNFYDALTNLGGIKALAGMPDSQDQRTAKEFADTPIFKAFYKAAQSARDNQPPGTPPDDLMNHLPPDVAALLR